MKAGYLAAATVALFAAVPLVAQDYKLGGLTITHAWTRQTAPGQSVGGGFMTIANRGKAADRLIAAFTPVSARVELHTMSMDGGVMRMRQVQGGLDIPAGGSLSLNSGGYHLMLIGLKKPLVRGATVPVTLQFLRAGKVTVQLRVEAISYGVGK